MTISVVNRDDYVGTGAVSVYAFTFRIFAPTDLQVTVRNLASIETTLHYPIDFTVSGVGLVNGGFIQLTAGNLTSGFLMTIRRVRPLVQYTDLRNQGTLQPEILEATFDHLMMCIQQLAGGNVISAPTGSQIQFPLPETGKVIGWNSFGQLRNYSLPSGVGGVAGSMGVSVKEYGAKGDARQVYDAIMGLGSNILQSATMEFTDDDIGKKCPVVGAGLASAALLSSIVSINDSSHAVLADSALTAVSGGIAYVGSDDSTAFAEAYSPINLPSNYRVIVPTGLYFIDGAVELYQAHQTIGAGVDTSQIVRIGLGTGGAFVRMAAGEQAQKVQILDITINGLCLGSNNDVLALGTEGNNFAFGNGGKIDNVRVINGSGVLAHLNCNAGVIGQLWCQNHSSLGTPDALSLPNSMGFKSENTAVYADLLSIEGRYENGDMSLGAGGSDIKRLSLQPLGNYPTKDLITITQGPQDIGRIFIQTGGATRRDIVRVNSGAGSGVVFGPVYADNNFPITATNIVNDLHIGRAFPYSTPDRSFFPRHDSDLYNHLIFDDQLQFHVGKRLTESFGTQVVAAASLLLPNDGNTFVVNGNTRIEAIYTADWDPGSVIRLAFAGSPFVSYNSISGDPGTAPIYPEGDVRLQALPGMVLELIYDSQKWVEVSRRQPYAGSFTPSVLPTLNLTAVQAYPVQYSVSGSTVTVSGRVDVTPTLTEAECILTMSLPIFSFFTQLYQCGGVAVSSGTVVAGMVASIFPLVGSSLVRFQWAANVNSFQPMYFTFSYQIV